MISTVEFGDVHICLFPFTSGRNAKPRPVLILRDLDPDCLICRITSIPHQGFLDLRVAHWQDAGLEKPSTIRLSRLVTIEKVLLRQRIGRLMPDDLEFVRVTWNKQFRL